MDYMQWEREDTSAKSVDLDITGIDIFRMFLIEDGVYHAALALIAISREGGLSRAETYALEYRTNLFSLN